MCLHRIGFADGCDSMEPKLRRYAGTCRMLDKSPDIGHPWTQKHSSGTGSRSLSRVGVELAISPLGEAAAG